MIVALKTSVCSHDMAVCMGGNGARTQLRVPLYYSACMCFLVALAVGSAQSIHLTVLCEGSFADHTA